ncbi:MAG: hypothetical protein PHZ04_03955 [Patescibacteria group bacterium]|nr:hypothetical protein [Patescibacteria group bacterium]MDD5294334.1 hypothetical protein [Patescibacteria group bacterium]MDD5554049.1 hypothetical protein [Patescibacteria group bacterium]
MYPKTALKILLVIVLIAVLVFAGLYIKKKYDLKNEESRIEDIISKKRGQQELSQEEQEKLNAYIDQKVEEKRSGLNEKTEEEIKTQGYTQDEVNFILDPQRTVEKELGIAEEKESTQMTQEEIDAILNPKQ